MTAALVEIYSGLWMRRQHPRRALSDFRLIALDMDSTLITIECIDELADVAGKRTQVAAITEAAMRGEITDFRDSLMRRLALLAGLPERALEQVYLERLQLSPGAPALLQACRRAGLKTLLVSGGFTFFAERLRERLTLDFVRSNALEVRDGCLTGRVLKQSWGDVCDGALKRATLLDVCSLLGVSPAQAIAVGDGSNDIPMLQAAGLAVAFHAKPNVRQAAEVAIDSGGLERLLDVLT